MTVPTHLGDRPSVRVAEACTIHGSEVVARWCADLLDGTVAPDDPSAPSSLFLGGPHAAMLLDTSGWRQPGNEHWPRVWAPARGLLYAWIPAAAPSVVSALDDPAWRVREMAPIWPPTGDHRPPDVIVGASSCYFDDNRP